MKRAVGNTIVDLRVRESREPMSGCKVAALVTAGIVVMIFIGSMIFAYYKLHRKYDSYDSSFNDRSFNDTSSVLHLDDYETATERSARLRAERPHVPSLRDTLEKIDILHAQVSGLRGHESIKLDYITDQATLVGLLGEPDRTAPMNGSCERKTKITHYFYGTNRFDLESDGTVALRTLDLKANPSLKLKLGNIALSPNMTLGEFQQLFPISAKHGERNRYTLVPKDGEENEEVRLTFGSDGHLEYVFYWISC